jgi:hypothetical protein
MIEQLKTKLILIQITQCSCTPKGLVNLLPCNKWSLLGVISKRCFFKSQLKSLFVVCQLDWNQWICEDGYWFYLENVTEFLYSDGLIPSNQQQRYAVRFIIYGSSRWIRGAASRQAIFGKCSLLQWGMSLYVCVTHFSMKDDETHLTQWDFRPLVLKVKTLGYRVIVTVAAPLAAEGVRDPRFLGLL